MLTRMGLYVPPLKKNYSTPLQAKKQNSIRLSWGLEASRSRESTVRAPI